MKEGWKYKKIGDICSITDFVSNGSFASLKENVKYYNTPNYAVLVRLADASNGFDKTRFVYTDEHGYDFSKKSHLHGGELIMSNVGSVGSMFICPELNQPMTLAPNTISITSKNNRFLYYYFMSDGFKVKLNGITSSTTLKKFNKTNFKLLEITIPPLSEQQSIVDYLDSAFAKIDSMKANAEKALNEAKALFQASLTKLLEPKKGWEKKRIDEVCSIARGGSPRPIKDYITNDSNGLNWIKIGDTDMGGKYIYSTKEKIKPEGLKKSRWVEEDEFLLSNSMSFGRPYILKTNGCIHDGWLVLRDYQKYLNIDFFYYVLSSENVQRQFRTKAQGSTVSNLNTDRVASVTIYIPLITEQQSIVDTLDSLKSKVDRLQENYDKISRECDALKQAILRQVFE